MIMARPPSKHSGADTDPDAGSGRARLAQLILSLRSQGVSEPAVLNALETTPRDLFTPGLFQDRAWEDSA